jgi:uncharacterized membrane protein YeaQ/YmgE (transglycosylase-associated protein family)
LSIVLCSLIGLIAGLVATQIFNGTGKSVTLDYGLGVTGAVVAGSLFNHMAMTGAAGLTFASLFVASAGAAVLLIPYHAMVREKPAPGRKRQ